MVEDRNSHLHRVLDALADLLASVTEDNEALAEQVRADLENDGCLILAYRPQAGRVEVALGTADKEPVTLFEAVPAKKAKDVPIN